MQVMTVMVCTASADFDYCIRLFVPLATQGAYQRYMGGRLSKPLFMYRPTCEMLKSIHVTIFIPWNHFEQKFHEK